MAQMTALRRRMIDDMTVRNLSPATQQSYVYAVAKFSRFFACSPDRLGIEEVRTYQLRAQWLADRQSELLPVPYFHVVFTVPAPIAQIALHNKAVVYGILFTATADTLRVIAADPRHLGAEIGLVAVLHTWGQNLHHHPHVHCVVPGGGPSVDRTRWIGCRPGFFLPVKVLARLYRRLFLTRLQAAFDTGQLRFFGDLSCLATPAMFASRLRPLRTIRWVVYAKRPD